MASFHRDDRRWRKKPWPERSEGLRAWSCCIYTYESIRTVGIRNQVLLWNEKRNHPSPPQPLDPVWSRGWRNVAVFRSDIPLKMYPLLVANYWQFTPISLPPNANTRQKCCPRKKKNAARRKKKKREKGYSKITEGCSPFLIASSYRRRHCKVYKSRFRHDRAVTEILFLSRKSRRKKDADEVRQLPTQIKFA